MGIAKRPLDTVDLTETSPKRHQPEAINDTLSTEGILSRIALSDLKSCFRELLSDPLCGPTVKAHLQTYADKALEAEREQTKQKADEIRKRAGNVVARARAHSEDPKNHLFEIGDLGKAVAPFLRPAHDLWRSGSKTNAPSLVFDLLMDFADWIVWSSWDMSKIYGDNEDNDYVHHDIESILVGIVQEELEKCEDPKKWIHSVETKDRVSKVDKLNASIDETCHKYVHLKQLLETGTQDGESLTIDLENLGREYIMAEFGQRHGGGRRFGSRRGR